MIQDALPTPRSDPRRVAAGLWRRPVRDAALDHAKDHGGDKTKRDDRHNRGHCGCEFHGKLLSDRRGAFVAMGNCTSPLVDGQDVSFLHCTTSSRRSQANKRGWRLFGFTAPNGPFSGAAKQLQTLPAGMVKGGIVDGRPLCGHSETIPGTQSLAVGVTQ
jgi:hypothetical protein